MCGRLSVRSSGCGCDSRLAAAEGAPLISLKRCLRSKGTGRVLTILNRCRAVPPRVRYRRIETGHAGCHSHARGRRFWPLSSGSHPFLTCGRTLFNAVPALIRSFYAGNSGFVIEWGGYQAIFIAIAALASIGLVVLIFARVGDDSQLPSAAKAHS